MVSFMQEDEASDIPSTFSPHISKDDAFLLLLYLVSLHEESVLLNWKKSHK
jgi:hypothetical protein